MASVGEEPELRILRWRRTGQEETRKADLGKSKERGSLQDSCGKTTALCGATAEPRSLGWSEQRGKNGEQRHLYWTIPGTSILICSPWVPIRVRVRETRSQSSQCMLSAAVEATCPITILRQWLRGLNSRILSLFCDGHQMTPCPWILHWVHTLTSPQRTLRSWITLQKVLRCA